MRPWLRYLIAFVVGAHGFVYIRFGLGKFPETLEGWKGSSWLLGSAVTGDRLKALAFAVALVAGISTLGCAVAIGFASSDHGWWRPLAVASAAFGISSFAILWDGQPQRLVYQGVIGVVVSVILLVSAIVFPRAFS